MARTHKLMISFRSKEDMLDYARQNTPAGTAVYHADALDREYAGRPPADAYILRNYGAKPDKFLATRSKIGADA